MYSAIIVEDEKKTREGLKGFINNGNFGVEVKSTATNGEEAYELLCKNNFDIIITDVKMPKMNGIELVERIKKQKSDIKIIFISGYSDVKFLKSAIKNRAVDYILKPINILEISETIKRTVELCKSEDEIKASHKMELRNNNELGSLSQIVREIKNIIESDYSKDISVQSIADKLYLTPTYICAVFRKEMGCTINNYLTDIRINKSIELMRDPKLKLYEIAEMIGYSDVDYFSRVFKKRMMVNPTEYRNKMMD